MFSHVSSNGLLEHVGFCYHFGKKLHVSLSDGGDRSISWTAMVSTDHFLPSRAELHSRGAELQTQTLGGDARDDTTDTLGVR